MYRYARGAPGLRGPFCRFRPLLLPCWVYAPSSLARRAALPWPPRRGTRKRAPEASTAQRANLGARASLASPRFLSLRLTSPRLASSRVLATSARERLVYRFGFRSNYLQRCSRAGEKHVDRGPFRFILDNILWRTVI
ncbi:hypothetical protein PUN28_000731 [Cardiocondyla obscurior]|uniref:Uncharacterized protein n=1 Tax=Cardiocondyla obscurior TaxID=286306 RepID=A0AAW2H171_9HYME